MRNTIGALLLAAIMGFIGYIIGHGQGMKAWSFSASDAVLYTTVVLVTDTEGVVLETVYFNWSDDFSNFPKGLAPSRVFQNSDGSYSLAISGLNLDTQFYLEVSASGYEPQLIEIEAQRSGVSCKTVDLPVRVKLKKE